VSGRKEERPFRPIPDDVIPGPAECGAGVNFGGDPEPIEKTGFLPEFIPAKAGAGMTNWKTVGFLRDHQH
jgi:hypothetical protein